MDEQIPGIFAWVISILMRNNLFLNLSKVALVLNYMFK